LNKSYISVITCDYQPASAGSASRTRCLGRLADRRLTNTAIWSTFLPPLSCCRL